jgi:hypothetical protein
MSQASRQDIKRIVKTRDSCASKLQHIPKAAELIQRKLPSMYHQFKQLADIDISTTQVAGVVGFSDDPLLGRLRRWQRLRCKDTQRHAVMRERIFQCEQEPGFRRAGGQQGPGCTGLGLMGFGFVVARFGLFLREIAQVGEMKVGVHPGLAAVNTFAGTLPAASSGADVTATAACAVAAPTATPSIVGGAAVALQ